MEYTTKRKIVIALCAVVAVAIVSSVVYFVILSTRRVDDKQVQNSQINQEPVIQEAPQKEFTAHDEDWSFTLGYPEELSYTETSSTVSFYYENPNQIILKFEKIPYEPFESFYQNFTDAIALFDEQQMNECAGFDGPCGYSRRVATTTIGRTDAIVEINAGEESGSSNYFIPTQGMKLFTDDTYCILAIESCKNNGYYIKSILNTIKFYPRKPSQIITSTSTSRIIQTDYGVEFACPNNTKCDYYELFSRLEIYGPFHLSIFTSKIPVKNFEIFLAEKQAEYNKKYKEYKAIVDEYEKACLESGLTIEECRENNHYYYASPLVVGVKQAFGTRIIFQNTGVGEGGVAKFIFLPSRGLMLHAHSEGNYDFPLEYLESIIRLKL